VQQHASWSQPSEEQLMLRASAPSSAPAGHLFSSKAPSALIGSQKEPAGNITRSGLLQEIKERKVGLAAAGAGLCMGARGSLCTLA
jgi:hypothetical protein